MPTAQLQSAPPDGAAANYVGAGAAREEDRYGRTVARIILPDGRDLGQAIVAAGLAWWYRKYAPGDKQLERLEAESRAAKRGLWAEPNPVPPWEWRAGERGKQPAGAP